MWGWNERIFERNLQGFKRYMEALTLWRRPQYGRTYLHKTCPVLGSRSTQGRDLLSRVVWLEPLTPSQSNGAHPSNNIIRHKLSSLQKVENLVDRALVVWLVSPDNCGGALWRHASRIFYQDLESWHDDQNFVLVFPRMKIEVSRCAFQTLVIQDGPSILYTTPPSSLVVI